MKRVGVAVRRNDRGHGHAVAAYLEREIAEYRERGDNLDLVCSVYAFPTEGSDAKDEDDDEYSKHF